MHRLFTLLMTLALAATSLPAAADVFRLKI